MDTLTHIALGAVVGEVIGGKSLGRKAAVAGALIALMPDLDVAVQPFLASATSMLFHRGITHSFFVWLVVSPFIGYAIWRFYRNTPKRTWIMVSLAAWFSHIFIDGFNSYGTAWFLPFSQYRVAGGSIAVVDVFLTLPLFAFLVVLILQREATVIKLARWLIGYVAVYMCLSLVFQGIVESRAANEFREKQIAVSRIHAYAVPFSMLVWQVNGETDSSFVLANQGIFKSGSGEFFTFKKRWDLLAPAANNAEVSKAIRFTQNQYIVTQRFDTLFVSDLRLAPLVLDGVNTPFVVSFPVVVNGNTVSVGKAYPKRIVSKRSFYRWADLAF